MSPGKILFTALLLTVALAAPPAVAAGDSDSADARAAKIRFTKIQYDSPGTDTGSNSSLNAEWVRLTNKGNRAKQLKDWKLRDRAGHVYRFPRFKLRPGRSVKIHTGRGSSNGRNLYWRQDNYVWNNDGDRAVLKNRAGRVIDRCSWGSSGSGSTSC